MNDDLFALQNFQGIARLFPLPNLVLFPNVVQPLHIFEPRYRQMTADALGGDKLMAIVRLRPGWEAEYEGQPAVHEVGCLGRIVAEQRLEDGRFNLLLRGLSRARIVRELDDDSKAYRIARMQLLGDADAPAFEEARELVERIKCHVLPWFPAQGPALEQVHKLLHGDMPLGVLCDILSFALPLPPDVKQELLEQLHVGRRANLLIEHLEKAAPVISAADRKFPPEFSSN